MSKTSKILLSIPSVIAFAFVLTFWFPFLISDFETYTISAIIVRVLLLFQVLYLSIRIWRFKNVKKPKKTKWILLIVFFSAISSLVYIWKKDKEYSQVDLVD